MRTLRRFVRTRSGTALATSLVVAAIAVPSGVWAADSFSDVPTTNPFHDDIAAVAEAGVTSGFPDGTFRPSNTVTRQAMAAFVHRAAGRVAQGGSQATLNGVTPTEIGVATVDAGAFGSGTGFVQLLGTAYAYVDNAADAATCPCTVQLDLYSAKTRLATSYLQLGSTLDTRDVSLDAGSIQAVTPLAAGATRTYQLVARLFSPGSTDVGITGHLTATYVPFSGHGNDSEVPLVACPRDDGYEQNDTQSAAHTLYASADATAVASAIACREDPDWFMRSEVLTEGTTITATANFSNAEGDINICIVNPAGVDVSCGTGTVDNEVAVYDVPTDGRYAIRVDLVEDQGELSGNTYELLISRS